MPLNSSEIFLLLIQISVIISYERRVATRYGQSFLRTSEHGKFLSVRTARNEPVLVIILSTHFGGGASTLKLSHYMPDISPHFA